MTEQSFGRRKFLAAGSSVAVGLSVFTTSTAARNENNPTTIANWYDLNRVRDNSGGDFLVINDLSEISPGYNIHVSDPASGWEPIGSSERPFDGTFDGNGHTIADLVINREQTDGVGLFGEVTGGGITDLTLESPTVIGGDDVGAVIGRNEGGTGIEEITVSDGVINGDSDVGGVVGTLSDSEIVASTASATVEADGTAGGLVGTADISTVAESDTTGEVAGDITGGLVGRLDESQIRNSRATVDVLGDRAGGLIGSMILSAVSQSSATGAVEGDNNTGGLVGYVGSCGSVTASYATGTVDGDSNVGGLIGEFEGSAVRESYATGDVTGEESVGGLIGESLGDEVIKSYAVGAVSGETEVGGLIGYNLFGSVRESYATGSVEGEEAVGGLVGRNYDTVTDGYWDVPATGQETTAGGDGTGFGTTDDEAPADEKIGEAAAENMDGFDFEQTWTVVTDPDHYPSLAWQDEPIDEATEEAETSDEEQAETSEEEQADTDDDEVAEDGESEDGETDTEDDESANEDEEADVDDGDDAGDNADDDGPGFGFEGALAGVGGVAYLLKRRLGTTELESK